jgi:hypothetical protein
MTLQHVRARHEDAVRRLQGLKRNQAANASAEDMLAQLEEEVTNDDPAKSRKKEKKMTMTMTKNTFDRALKNNCATRLSNLGQCMHAEVWHVNLPVSFFFSFFFGLPSRSAS